MTGTTTKRKRVASPTGHRDTDDDVHSDVDKQSETSRKKAKQQDATVEPLPVISDYLKSVQGGLHWRGHYSFQNIVVMGDSYSKTSSSSKNWVDYLKDRLRRENIKPKIHNFAVPGATAEDDLSDQLTRFFARFPKKESPTSPPPLDAAKTTYCVYIGINDCGRTDVDELEAIVETVLDAVHDLYVKAGARNFLLVDVPPVDRSPQATNSGSSDEIKERVEAWNALLQAQAVDFGTNSKEATMLLFSSHHALTEVLDDPSEFEFAEDDVEAEGGAIWEDDLHLTESVHEHLGERLFQAVFSTESP